MGSLLTTSAGGEITGIANGGAVELDFLAGTISLPQGSQGNLTRTMNKSLNDLQLNQCNSIAVWCSDADATYQIGSAISLSDHQLSHVVCNYGFSTVRINIPSNSIPTDTNQIFFMASTDGWLGYSFPRISHQRGTIDTTNTTDGFVDLLSKHVGAYNQFLVTVDNTGGSNSLDVSIQYSEDGTNFFPTQGYGTAVTVTSGSYDSFASEVEHHFYKVSVKSTSAGNATTCKIYYNFVNDKGSAFL